VSPGARRRRAAKRRRKGRTRAERATAPPAHPQVRSDPSPRRLSADGANLTINGEHWLIDDVSPYDSIDRSVDPAGPLQWRATLTATPNEPEECGAPIYFTTTRPATIFDVVEREFGAVLERSAERLAQDTYRNGDIAVMSGLDLERYASLVGVVRHVNHQSMGPIEAEDDDSLRARVLGHLTGDDRVDAALYAHAMAHETAAANLALERANAHEIVEVDDLGSDRNRRR
jgi:hypothetical protein